MLLGFLMISELIFTFELFLTDLTVKFVFMLLLMFVVWSRLVTDDGRDTVHLVLLPVVFLNLTETLFFKALLDMFHLLLLFLFLALTFKLFLLLLLFFLPKPAQISNKARISFAHVGKKIFDGLHISLSLSLPLFFVLLLHLATHPSTIGVPGVPFLTPCKGLVGGKILPILVKFEYSSFTCCRISKAFILAYVLCQVFAMGVCLSLLGF